MYVCICSVRNEGGGGRGGGGVNPPIPVQDPGICAFQGDPGWVPQRPPINIKMSFMNCFKLLSITRNKTCYKDKWVTLKTLLVA